MVQNGVPRVCFYFCSMVQNSEHFSPLRNSSERNSDRFLFRGTAGVPPEQTNCSVSSVFCRIIFCLKLPTLGVPNSNYSCRNLVFFFNGCRCPFKRNCFRYPYLCALRSRGYKGQHICGVTLLSGTSPLFNLVIRTVVL
jgi:hypothetical protein